MGGTGKRKCGQFCNTVYAVCQQLKKTGKLSYSKFGIKLEDWNKNRENLCVVYSKQNIIDEKKHVWFSSHCLFIAFVSVLGFQQDRITLVQSLSNFPSTRSYHDRQRRNWPNMQGLVCGKCEEPIDHAHRRRVPRTGEVRVHPLKQQCSMLTTLEDL